jgi:hypothetical protein
MKNPDEQEEPSGRTPNERDDDQSVILNQDVQFENREIDPGFAPVPKEGEQEPEKEDPLDIDKKQRQGENQGLAELDGTNPGSNAHPMDDDEPF